MITYISILRALNVSGHKMIKMLAIICTLIMLVSLMYGFIRGDFFKEGSILLSLAWGKISFIDVYIGFFLFSAWVVYREKKRSVAVLWIILILLLGNLISTLYVTICLFKSNENLQWFWLGKHYKTKR
ncbi:MAG: DUF1475 family protein [Bacteroidota bacterium]